MRMLRLVGNCIVSIILLGVLEACSPTYLPIGDHKVFADFYMPSGGTGATAQALFCTPDESFCGRREEEGYDPDQFFYSTEALSGLDVDELAMHWTREKATQGNMSAGIFQMSGVMLGTKKPVRIRFNDSGFGEATIPPFFMLTEPGFSSQHSRAAQNTLQMLWEPAQTALSMHWELFPVNNESEEKPCDALEWGILKGQTDDTGALEIPLDGVPTNLPPEGCEVLLLLRRRAEGTLPPELPAGYIRGEVVDGVIFSFLP